MAFPAILAHCPCFFLFPSFFIVTATAISLGLCCVFFFFRLLLLVYTYKYSTQHTRTQFNGLTKTMTTPIGDRSMRSHNPPNNYDTPTRCNYQSAERGALCSIVDPNNCSSPVPRASGRKSRLYDSLIKEAKEGKAISGSDLNTGTIPSSTHKKRPVSTYARWLSKTAYPYQLGRSLLRREMYGLSHTDLRGRLGM
jgi:hypothetical protein